MECRICHSLLSKIFEAIVLNKYVIAYYQCGSCGFLQTEEPFWLSEAYSSAIASTDVGYVSRNLKLANKIESLIFQHFDPQGRFLDYAGGYGLFVRLMRDKGLNFYWQDEYCNNLFAQYFDLHALDVTQRLFELVTGFEVMEHLFNPYQMLDEIFTYSDSFVFSTELQPDICLQDWWYLALEGGQHISFYTLQSLQYLADKYTCRFYSNRKNLHLFTRKQLQADPFQSRDRFSFFSRLFRKKKRIQLKSLLQNDYHYVKSRNMYSAMNSPK